VSGIAPAQKASEAAVLVIEAGRPEHRYWKELWQYRELLYYLTWRDIAVRYKQTSLGIIWAILRPLITMAVFTVVFGMLARLPSEGVPYPIFVFAAMLPWQFFSNGISECGNSLVGNAGMLSKVYFPRMILPASGLLTTFVDLLIAGGLLAGLMFWYGYAPGWQIVALPAFIALAMLFTLALGVWFATLNVEYRDFRYIIPFVIQLGVYASPVGYASSIVPDHWRLVYALNPMVGIIDGFRWSICSGRPEIYWPGLGISIALTVLLLISGLIYFRRMERTFADVV
jgi:lipopolysaccharide transport system permease protein